MSSYRRAVLEQVAAGELDPAEAARLLRTSAPSDRAPARTLTVAATGVRLTVVADPGVAAAAVDGPHRLREEGDRLVVEIPGHPRGLDGFEVRPRWQWGKLRIDWPYGIGERVVVRVNPALPLTLQLAACDAHVRGTRAAVELGCYSGSLHLLDHAGPLRGIVTSAAAVVEAALRGPDDELSCDMSTLRLTLLPGSDTTVVTTSELSTVKLSPGRGERPDGRVDPRADLKALRATSTTVVGGGSGRFALGVRMGTAKVVLP